MTLTQISTAGVKDDAVTSGKIPANAVGTSEIADQAVTLAKLPHGTSSNDGKFLRANNGADPTFETVTSTTINNNANNRLITGSGTANTLEGESKLTFDGTILKVQDTAIPQGYGSQSSTLLVLEDSGDTSLELGSGHNNTSSVFFGDTGASNKGQINYHNGSGGDAMSFHANGSECMRIDSSGNVGIGTSSPSGKLHVRLATDKHIVFNPSQGEVGNVPCIIPVNDSSALTDLGFRANHLNFAAGTGSQSSTQKMTIDDTGVGIGAGNIDAAGLLHIDCGTDKNIVYSGNIGEIGDLAGFQCVNDALNANTGFGIRASEMRFAINSAEEFRITGNGVTFNGDTAAANALDDYEEGSHTPADASGQVTFNDATGHYTKIGRQVIFEGSVTWPSTGGQYGVGITLPFAGSSNGRTAGGGFTRYTNKSESQTSHVNASSSNFTLYTYGGQQIKNADMSGKRFDFVIVYSTGH